MFFVSSALLLWLLLFLFLSEWLKIVHSGLHASRYGTFVLAIGDALGFSCGLSSRT